MRNIFLATLLAIGFLSGCATYTIHSTSIDSTKPLPVGSGVVAVQVISNTDRLAPLHKGWTEVIAVRLDNMDALKSAAEEKAKQKATSNGKTFDKKDIEWDPDIYSFHPVYKGTVDSQLFIGNMPEGKYVISSLYSYYNDGNVSSWISMPVFYSAGKFKVQSKTLTDLGSIIFQPLLNVKERSFWSSKSSSKAFVTRSFQQQTLGQFVISHYPIIKQQLGNKEPIGWLEDELDDLRKNLSQLAEQNAFAANSIMFSESGKKVLGAKFGRLNVLQDEQWQTINLPTNSQLYAALELNEQVLVGGELGQLFVSDNWQQWQLENPLDSTEAIVWFGQTDAFAYALTSSAKQYRLYQFNTINQPWKQIGSFTKKDPNDWLIQNGGLFTFITQSGLLRVFNDNQQHDFNEVDGSWTKAKGLSLRAMTQVSNGILVGVEVSQWDGVGSQIISRDDGLTWVKVNRSLNWFGDNKADVSLPAITTDGKIVTLGRAKQASNSKSGLMVISSDLANVSNGKSWTTHAAAREDCQTLLPQLTTGSRIYFLCDQGEIISTNNFGDTWKMEIERSIANMQEQFEGFIEALKAKQKAEEQEKDPD
ncbi:MAG: hypothetical protein GY829_06755 [Gammaproteobacteria bacterium]|nr:hypothetical protein [Gammaproteobacteria bacterium]